MTITLVDSNILLDFATEDPRWSGWSERALVEAADCGGLAINPIVYAEVSVGFATIEELDDALPAETFARVPVPYTPGSWPGKRSWTTAAVAAPRCRRCPTSISGHTRRSPAIDHPYRAVEAMRSGCVVVSSRGPENARTAGVMPRICVRWRRADGSS